MHLTGDYTSICLRIGAGAAAWKWRLEYVTLIMGDNQIREEGRREVYHNLRKCGFSKKEASDLAGILDSVMEQEEKESKQNICKRKIIRRWC